jgi:hypothetical protein
MTSLEDLLSRTGAARDSRGVVSPARRGGVSVKVSECPVSKLVDSDTCPCSTTGGHRDAAPRRADDARRVFQARLARKLGPRSRQARLRFSFILSKPRPVASVASCLHTALSDALETCLCLRAFYCLRRRYMTLYFPPCRFDALKAAERELLESWELIAPGSGAGSNPSRPC